MAKAPHLSYPWPENCPVVDFWSYSHKASGNLSFNPHSYSELSHLLGPQSSVEVEWRWDSCGPWGFKRCERNRGQDSSLHTFPAYVGRGQPRFSGLEGRGAGPGTAVAKDPRDLPALRDRQVPGYYPLHPLYSPI